MEKKKNKKNMHNIINDKFLCFLPISRRRIRMARNYCISFRTEVTGYPEFFAKMAFVQYSYFLFFSAFCRTDNRRIVLNFVRIVWRSVREMILIVVTKKKKKYLLN